MIFYVNKHEVKTFWRGFKILTKTLAIIFKTFSLSQIIPLHAFVTCLLIEITFTHPDVICYMKSNSCTLTPSETIMKELLLYKVRYQNSIYRADTKPASTTLINVIKSTKLSCTSLIFFYLGYIRPQHEIKCEIDPYYLLLGDRDVYQAEVNFQSDSSLGLFLARSGRVSHTCL